MTGLLLLREDLPGYGRWPASRCYVELYERDVTMARIYTRTIGFAYGLVGGVMSTNRVRPARSGSPNQGLVG